MGRLWQPAVLCLLFTLTLPSAPVASQGGGDEVQVEMEAPVIDGVITPVTDRRNGTFQVRVGCEAMEASETRTKVDLEILEEPPGSQVAITATSASWRSAPGDCPSDGTPFVGNATVSVALSHDAPGFVEQTVPIQATVTKRSDPPMNEPRTYGPYNTTLTFTPGYYHQHTVEVHGTQDAGPDAVARFNVALESQANAPARFTIQAEEAPSWVKVSFEPDEIELAPGEEAPIGITAEQVGPAEGNGQAVLSFNTTGAPVDPRGDEGGSHAFAVIVDFSETREDAGQSGVPGFQATWLALGAALGALLARRPGHPA